MEIYVRCNLNVPDTWGEMFPSEPDWDLIIASDILLCKGFFPSFHGVIIMLVHLVWYDPFLLLADVKQYSNLIKTLSFLLKAYKPKDKKAGVANVQVKQVITISGKFKIPSQWSKLVNFVASNLLCFCRKRSATAVATIFDELAP